MTKDSFWIIGIGAVIVFVVIHIFAYGAAKLMIYVSQ